MPFPASAVLKNLAFSSPAELVLRIYEALTSDLENKDGRLEKLTKGVIQKVGAMFMGGLAMS